MNFIEIDKNHEKVNNFVLDNHIAINKFIDGNIFHAIRQNTHNNPTHPVAGIGFILEDNLHILQVDKEMNSSLLTIKDASKAINIINACSQISEAKNIPSEDISAILRIIHGTLSLRNSRKIKELLINTLTK